MKAVEAQKLRSVAEDALRLGGVIELSDREIARLTGVSAWLIGRCRRRLESRGAIPVVDRRLGHHGGWIDVTRIGEARKYRPNRRRAPLQERPIIAPGRA